jgi:predicted ABC-type ATPase
MKRLRIFAGPNGSGKTTLKSVLKKEYLGVYINADDIEKEIKDKELNFDEFNVKVTDGKELEFKVDEIPEWLFKILNEKGLI